MKKKDDSQSEFFNWQNNPKAQGLYCQKVVISTRERDMIREDARRHRQEQRGRQRLLPMSAIPQAVPQVKSKKRTDPKRWEGRTQIMGKPID